MKSISPEVVCSVPLCVDLDGTLVRTDTLFEQFFALCQQKPLSVLSVPFWLFGGRARMKAEIAARVDLEWEALPRQEELVCWLLEQHAAGRPLYLVTAADQKIAVAIAKQFGFFEDVIGSKDSINLDGARKAAVLEKRFGTAGFDYVGNSSVDLHVWRVSRQAIVVNASPRVEAKARDVAHVAKVFSDNKPTLKLWVKGLRVHQWAKNLIVFVPIITSHRILDFHSWGMSALAFLALSACASSVYVLNDLIDLPHDRKHPRKMNRPFAAGHLSLVSGMIAIPILLLISIVLSLGLPHSYILVLTGYYALTVSYSLFLKSQVLVDVLVLSLLYTLRLIAGHAATGICISTWLLVFAMFLFFSLALVKRYSELLQRKMSGNELASGRGYTVGDIELTAMLGCSSGCIAVLVLALYINSPEVTLLYSSPKILLIVCVLFFYWIGRVWLLATRGQLDEDPVLFAINDRGSYIVAGLIFLAMLLAATI